MLWTKKIFLLVGMLSAFFTKAQSFSWAKGSTGNGLDEGIAICHDNSGNVIITGHHTSSVLTIGTFTVNNSATQGIITAKYNSAGNVLWIRQSISTQQDFGSSVACDAAGNIYITGYYNSPTIIFGTFTLTNNGYYDLFLVKYDSNGNVLWAQSAGAESNDYGYSVKTDINNNLYLAGSFASSVMVIGTATLNQNGVCDSYVVKMNSSGVVQWADNPNGAGGDENWSVCPDAAGNVYVAGDYISTSIIFQTYTITNPGLSSIYLVKYNSAGIVQWVYTTGGSSIDVNNWVEVDPMGNPVMTGNFQSASLTFGTNTLVNQGSSDIFIAKLDPAGNVLWATGTGSTGVDRGYAIGIDNTKIYTVGSFTGSVTFGSLTVTPPSNAPDPIYIATFDHSGNIQCLSYLVSGGDDQTGICADQSGYAYLTSDYVGTISIGATTLYPSGGENICTVKYLCGEIPVSLNEEQVSEQDIFYCNGDVRLSTALKGSSFKLTLTNVCGQKVFEKMVPANDRVVSLDGLCCGVFFAFVQDAKGEIVSRKKIVIRE
jgi:hypothetical protein